MTLRTSGLHKLNLFDCCL